MKKYRTIPLLLCLLLSGCGAQGTPKANSQEETTASEDTTAAVPTTEEVTEEAAETETEPQRSWQEIYAEVICEQQKAAENPDWMGYDLIYIDEDDVPELYVSQGVDYTSVYTIIDNSAAELHPLSYRRELGFTTYAERQGIYYTSTDGGYAYGGFEIWHVKNGVSEMTDVYSFDAKSDREDMDYFHNSESITKVEYDAALEKKAAESQRASSVSFAEIMRKIGYTTETWREQYGRIVEEANSIESPDTMRYALFYLNDDSIPELCVLNTEFSSGKIYSCLADRTEEIYSWEYYRECGFDGYTEKSGKFYTSSVYDVAHVGADVWRFENGVTNNFKKYKIEFLEDGTAKYFCDGEETSEESYRNDVPEDMQRPNYVSYEECISMMESFENAAE